MNEQQYTNREIDAHFKVVNDTLSAISKGVGELNDKVGIQNGRVVKMESRWSNALIGGAVLLFLLSAISGLGIYAFGLSQENLKSDILLDINAKNEKTLDSLKEMIAPLVSEQIKTALDDYLINGNQK